MLRQRSQTPKKTSSQISDNQTPRRSSRLAKSAAIPTMDTFAAEVRQPLLGPGASTTLSEQRSSPNTTPPSAIPEEENMLDLQNMSRKSQWIVLAVASGCCAACNGVFAKLTTTELTTSFATSIANLIGLAKVEKGVEVVVRAIFFGLNLIFNGIMWALFTKALARGTSTTQVSIINTSSNFMVTAILGFIIFSESLPPLWWAGAALLVAGNVIIGRREEGESKDSSDDAHDRAEEGRPSEEQEEGLLSGESVELDEDLEERKRKQEEDDILHLGSDDDSPHREEELISDLR